MSNRSATVTWRSWLQQQSAVPLPITEQEKGALRELIAARLILWEHASADANSAFWAPFKHDTLPSRHPALLADERKSAANPQEKQQGAAAAANDDSSAAATRGTVSLRSRLIQDTEDGLLERLSHRDARRYTGVESILPTLFGLQQELLQHHNHDVIAGCVYHHTMPHASVVSALRQKRVPGSSDMPETVPPSAADALTVVFDGGKIAASFPISCPYLCQSIYDSGDESEFGAEYSVERSVKDKRYRSSTEYAAGRLQLPDALAKPFHHFPAMAQATWSRLCENAVSVSAVPFKLICYQGRAGGGDFFRAHVDSVNEETESESAAHFGTLALHLPTQADYADDPKRMDDPEDFDYYHDDANSRDAKKDDDDDDEFVVADGEDRYEADLLVRGRGGALRFFTGRGLDPAFEARPHRTGAELLNVDHGKYERPENASQQLVATILFQNYSEEETVQGVPLPDMSRATSKVMPLAFDTDFGFSSSSSSAGAAAAAAAAASGTNRSRFIPLHFAAWHANVPHDVTPLRVPSKKPKGAPNLHAFRFIMTYKLVRRGLTVFRISSTQEQRLLNLMLELERKIRALPERARERAVRTFGFLCHHAYPLSRLQPANLKGVDRVAYHVASTRWTCIVAPVSYQKTCTPSHAFDLTCPGGMNRAQEQELGPMQGNAGLGRVSVTSSLVPPLTSQDVMGVANSLGQPGHIDERWEDEWAEGAADKAPTAQGVAWVELGLGNLRAKGTCYANNTCGFDYLYRSAAIFVIISQPSTWRWRKLALLIRLRSRDPRWKECFAVWNVMTTVALFLA